MADEQRDWPDWRIQFWTTLATDVPPAYPGGPSHKAGTPVYLTSVARDLLGLTTGFITASPAALAVSVAWSAALRGEHLRSQIAYEPVSASPFGAGFSITNATTPILYDYFEEGFVAVTLAYQAVEAYLNSVIADRLNGRVEIHRGKTTLMWDSEEAQRKATLDEKVLQLVPRVTGKHAPSRALLDRLNDVKRVRHDAVHLKGRDAYPRSQEPLTGYFHRLLSVDLRSFPRSSVDVMLHFDEDRPGWLKAADELTKEAKGTTEG